MNKYKMVFKEGDLGEGDKKVLIEGMLRYHASKGHRRKKGIFSISLHNKEGKFVGCVLASVLWNGLEIDSLWVDESLRRQGWGRKLMVAAEAEGVKRNCSFAYTNTFSWQAPEFYQQLGYTLYGKLNNFPEGCTLRYFQKKLN